MLQFKKINRHLLPPAFGFRNSGSTCYFNALTQCLLSLTSLTNVFLSNKNNPNFLNNPVANVYLKMLLYLEQIKLYKSNVLTSANRAILATQNLRLWHTMMQYIKQNHEYSYFGHGQEDSSEGFVLLMVCWEKIPEINILFDHAYCGYCKCFK
jgi:ubiquitin C-terminal hydrolase